MQGRLDFDSLLIYIAIAGFWLAEADPGGQRYQCWERKVD